MTELRTSLREAADLLDQAERTHSPVSPLTETHPEMSVDDAYAIQLHNVRRRIEQGATIRGHKVGLTAKAMQEMFGVNEPDYGHLLDDMFEFEESTLPLDRYIMPRVEIEPAFVLGQPLRGPGLTVAQVMQATEYVVAAIEIIDSRIVDWQIQLADTVADNGSSAGVILAGRPVPLTSFDPRQIRASVTIDGQPIESGSGANILGNPVTAVTWLANAVARYGIGFDAGHVILPGTCCRAVPVTGPCVARGSFSTLGDVSVAFS